MSLSHLQYNGWPPSRLAMGCEQLGGTDWGHVEHGMVRRAVSRAVELGITVFDTADVYGLGRSEEELSRALGSRRKDAFIITKFGVRWRKDTTWARAKTMKDSSPGHLRDALEGSLRRLKLDAIPLYLVHWPDRRTPLEETLAALEQARREGKIMNYGLSNFSAEAIASTAEKFRIVAIEGSYSLIDRAGREIGYSLAARLGMARFAYGALGQGILTGKYSAKSKFDTNDRRYRLSQFAEDNWGRTQPILNALADISEKYQATIAETAVRWVLDSGFIDTAIVGVKSAHQIEENARALEWELAADDIETLSRVSNPL